MVGWFKKLIGDDPEKEIRRLEPLVAGINALEDDLRPLSDAELRAKTDEFKARLADGETLDEILDEAFAVVRETARRRLGERHYDVQLLGGMVLHTGKIAEMKTGEGKTLVSTLPLYLNALEGLGCHLVTVNDYLAKRDAQWMGPIYHSLGLSIGCLQHESAHIYDPEFNSDNQSLRHMRPVPRREAYEADITYGTNNEFGFDYLRDNMVVDLSQVVQRRYHPHHYAIVDEVDNILIDEARTPLIISGPAEETEETAKLFARIVPRLQEELDYTIDLKTKAVALTEEGIAKVEKLLGVKNIYDSQNYRLTRYLEAALKAHAIFRRDRDYVVRDGEIVIVDEFTGRLMFGRRWSDGLHQAVEAKEGVKIQRESVTYATITLQNYFRMYEKLAGMTGTAATEDEEFHTIYKLEVAPIPTNKPQARDDEPDYVYRSEEGKFRSVVEEIEDMHAEGRPVLVGTVSIEKSEHLADLLRRYGQCEDPKCKDYYEMCPIKAPEVLNAKHHEREATIVAQAGRRGAITIATNMAGRGTDIILGGNFNLAFAELCRKRGIDPDTAPADVLEPLREETRRNWQAEHDEVVELGGLHIIGTERHEARRIDNQLRGRAGRQGDPGSSRFYVSFEDDVMKRFAPDWLPGMLGRLGMSEDTPLESGWVTKAIETAQTKVEGHNFDIRKHVVQYDDVMNTHRDVIYSERRKILEGADLRSNISDMVRQDLTDLVNAHMGEHHSDEEEVQLLIDELRAMLPPDPSLNAETFLPLSREEALDWLLDYAERAYAEKEEKMGAQNMRILERLVMLGTIDRLWVEHLTAMDEMRQGIGLHAYGQRDPVVMYRREAHDMWEQLLENIRHGITRSIYHANLSPQAVPASPNVRAAASARTNEDASDSAPTAIASANNGRKVGRNDPCPCGSGKKYKKCHGMAA